MDQISALFNSKCIKLLFFLFTKGGYFLTELHFLYALLIKFLFIHQMELENHSINHRKNQKLEN